jgi:regulator of cell morphogenesis and NO signaling
MALAAKVTDPLRGGPNMIDVRIHIAPDATLADLAATLAGASRVFYRHGLDFCCHGRISLEESARKKGLDPGTLAREIEGEVRKPGVFERWDLRPLGEVVEHVLRDFHDAHRAEVPRLLEMARKVERVHGEKTSCPRGLAAHLELLAEELESHMRKEEDILFPLIRSGRGRLAADPIRAMEEEHDDHGKNLARLRELTNDYVPPPDACGTWIALYLGLKELEQQLMEHIHTENNILFPRALRS